MKKIILLFVFISLVVSGFATIHYVRVVNNQFLPKTVNARLNDTIVWYWRQGSHTTTSTSIPPGAAPWDASINQTNKWYGMQLTVAGTYKYKCTPHASAGMRGTINVSSGNPLELYNLDLMLSSNDALIQWKSEDAGTIDYLTVKRSFDGDEFQEIARLQATARSYVDDLDQVQQKYVYYMIEAIGISGEKQLSEIKMLTRENAAKKLIEKLSPNPVSSPGHLMVQFNADTEGQMLVQLFNQQGTLIKQTEMAAVKGLNHGHFHLGSISPGTYYAQFTLGKLQEKHVVVFN